MMSLYLDSSQLAQAFRKARARRRMTVQQFAKLICCLPEDLEAAEAGEPTGSIIAMVGHSAHGHNVNILLEFEDDGEDDLFNFEMHQAQRDAFGIIFDRRLSNSHDVVKHVMKQIARQHELAAKERASGALAFRQQQQALKITEDSVRDMVREAQRHFGPNA